MTNATLTVAFAAFRKHAAECDQCEPVRRYIAHGWAWRNEEGAAIPMALIFDNWWSACCPTGRHLIAAWSDACQEVLLARGASADAGSTPAPGLPEPQ